MKAGSAQLCGLTWTRNREYISRTMRIFQIIVRISIIIYLAELLIMQAFMIVPYAFGAQTEALLDSALLVILSTPFIYGLVVKPFVLARDEAIRKVSRLAHHDYLTDLSNRRFLTDYLEKCLGGGARQLSYGALLLIDLDDFKKINDVYGHAAGDVVLVEVAKRLQSVTRAENLVSRLGGDEFVIVLQHLGEDEATAHEKALSMATRFQETLEKPISCGRNVLQVDCSVGIRILGAREEGIHDVIRQADHAMYRAKHSGKGQVVFFEEIEGSGPGRECLMTG